MTNDNSKYDDLMDELASVRPKQSESNIFTLKEGLSKCSGLVHWEDPEGWGGEAGGRGDRDGEHM